MYMYKAFVTHKYLPNMSGIRNKYDGWGCLRKILFRQGGGGVGVGVPRLIIIKLPIKLCNLYFLVGEVNSRPPFSLDPHASPILRR